MVDIRDGSAELKDLKMLLYLAPSRRSISTQLSFAALSKAHHSNELASDLLPSNRSFKSVAIIATQYLAKLATYIPFNSFVQPTPGIFAVWLVRRRFGHD